jgi:hypothetical protein
VGGGTVPESERSAVLDGGSEDAEEFVRFVRGLKVDAASLRGLEASLLTREGVSVPEGGCDMMGYFGCMMRRVTGMVYDICMVG